MLISGDKGPFEKCRNVILVILLQTGENYRSSKKPFSRNLPAVLANFAADPLTLNLSSKHYLCTNLIVTTPVQ